MSEPWVSSDSIRTAFSQAMSTMYQREVPQYGTLLQLVAEVNQHCLNADPGLREALRDRDELARLGVERHGAIRVGTADELAFLRRIFALMGMYPVGYYDLAVASVPVHATAFRPIAAERLQRNPFRLFTSLLRLELIDDPALRQRAADLLARRDIFTPRCRELVAQGEAQGGLDAAQADALVSAVLETFRWHQHTTVDRSTYLALHQQHRLIADVVCFPGCHINHLTPRTLDIDSVQAQMPAFGITPKAIIEGPPRRACPILLRQTSFKALDEPVHFTDHAAGTHTARFGEIEQRGGALTAAGRALYDRLLADAGSLESNAAHQAHLRDVFRAFPDDHAALRQQGLAFYQYRLTDAGRAAPQRFHPFADREALIAEGLLDAWPIVYEDFLPVSAAGIFQSNLGSESGARAAGRSSRAQFEAALGATVNDEIALYAAAEADSLRACGLLR
ncbi:VOC family protein [Pantoea sp. 1.19]|uniref:2-oxoadipate dioxygenase/decarboxylase HglS n=1 Tax=Pantoea sp. 1.19 TaxID=1925589 RepID=UPI000948C7CC|nr:VOC family protein [Pantoea sp. 1.19]